MALPSGECPVCKQSFKASGDIVICPSCGAPYHRACWQKEGKCVFEAQHGPNFEYAAPEKAAAPQPGEGTTGQQGGGRAAGVLCSACGTVNEAENIFCDRCGVPLHTQSKTAAGAAGGAGPFGGGMFGGGPTLVNMNGQIDGIDKTDWATYIGPSSQVYLQRMTQMERRGSKTSFLFSAFIVTPFYFAYRKMWGWGVLSLILNLLFSSLQMFALAAEAGYVLFPWLTAQTLGTATLVGSYVSLAIQLVFGLFALYLYRRSCRKKITQLRTSIQNQADYRDALSKKGGASIVGPIVVGVILLAYAILMSNFLGDELLTTIAALL